MVLSVKTAGSVSSLLKQIWASSRGSSAALVNCRCCKKDVVTAGSEDESGGSRCLV